MKRFYCIGGTMGVGKTALCQRLKQLLPNCVFLDGDWCWDMQPFQVTEETKAMVMDNICHLLNNFLHCSAYETVIFCWVLHQQSIWDELFSRLDTGGWTVRKLVLSCSPAALRARLQGDIDAGLRSPEILNRSLARISLYAALDSSIQQIDTTAHSIGQTALELLD